MKKKSKILITGGSGFIGTRLCSLLTRKNMEFNILDIRESKKFPEKSILCDICEKDNLLESVNGELVFHLAAVHRDDTRPLSLYKKTNVDGTQNLCDALEKNGINKVVFTSSVAVYGFCDADTDESGEMNPFNEYGRTKCEAENVLRRWQEKNAERRSLTIIRPTVVYGEGNRGNVYNLFKQISSGYFVMIGSGRNKKSMAYVENLVSFLEHSMKFGPGVHVYNYVDKPDMDMNSLVEMVRRVLLGKEGGVGLRIGRTPALLLGYLADLFSITTGKSIPLSSIRVRKFTETTSFSSGAHEVDGFVAPISFEEGLQRALDYEFINHNPDAEVFYTE